MLCGICQNIPNFYGADLFREIYLFPCVEQQRSKIIFSSGANNRPAILKMCATWETNLDELVSRARNWFCQFHSILTFFVHCRNGVAVQYVNFVKDAEDPEAFLTASSKLFERLIQDNDSQVRIAFLEQIPNIVRGYKPAFKKLRMMSFLGDCIRDDNYNVRRLAQVAIGQLVEFARRI